MYCIHLDSSSEDYSLSKIGQLLDDAAANVGRPADSGTSDRNTHQQKVFVMTSYMKQWKGYWGFW